MRRLIIGEQLAFLKVELCGLAKTTTSGDQLVIPGPADHAARYTTTSAKKLVVASLTAVLDATVAASLKYGTLSLLNITRPQGESAHLYRSRTSIPAWGWKESPL